MLATTVSVASYAAVASLKLLQPVGQVLGYVLPYLSKMTPKINYNTKHLRKGDPLPPYTGKLRVYNMRYCPYAQRTILALNAKQVDFEVVNIHLTDKPEWLFSKSGFGKVPSLEIEENVCIFESLITAEYIDEKYPQRPLLPKDPAKKALDKIIIEATAPMQVLFYKSLRNKDGITEADTAAYYKALDFLQNQLKSRGTKFLGGNEPGFVDYMIWPWFERILVTDGAYGSMKIDSEKYKLLLKYLDDLSADPAIVRYAIPNDAYKNFFDKYINGATDFDYDFLLEK